MCVVVLFFNNLSVTLSIVLENKGLLPPLQPREPRLLSPRHEACGVIVALRHGGERIMSKRAHTREEREEFM